MSAARDLRASLGQLGVAAATGAIVLPLLELPWGCSSGVLVTAVLLLLPSFLVSSIVYVGIVTAERFRARRATPSTTIARTIALVTLGSWVFALGIYFSNVLLVAPPFGGLTLVGYALTVAVTAILLTVAFRAMDTKLGRRWLAWAGIRFVAAVSLGGSASAIAVIDAVAFPQVYAMPHAMAELAALAALGAGSIAFQRHTVMGRWTNRGVILAGLLLASALWLPLGTSASLGDIVRHPSVQRRALLGFASLWRKPPWPKLPPESCETRTSMPPVAAVPRPSGSDPPRLIVLVTIDTFRCGFGRIDRAELRNACPGLTSLLPEARSLLDAHAVAPFTYGSVAAMQMSGARPLGDRLHALDYDTTAIVNHPRILEPPGVRRSFDTIDESLVAASRGGTGVTSELTTDRALAWVREKSADQRRHFLWVHYFDPHAPYIEKEGSPWRLSSLSAYRAEVERSDAAVRRLLEGMRPSDVAPAVVLVTADHGEEFSDHGGTTHGFALYEESVRIPVVAWSNRPVGSWPKSLPSSSHEIGPFLLAIASNSEFESSFMAPLHTNTTFDELAGVVLNDWKLIEHRTFGFVEVYDLRNDPGERRDLAPLRPDKVHELRCLLPPSRVDIHVLPP